MDGEPYDLSYRYRTKYSNYEQDKPLLDELIKEKLVVQLEKTSKHIIYRYVGAKPKKH
jgi:hypothetical protein